MTLFNVLLVLTVNVTFLVLHALFFWCIRTYFIHEIFLACLWIVQFCDDFWCRLLCLLRIPGISRGNSWSCSITPGYQTILFPLVRHSVYTKTLQLLQISKNYIWRKLTIHRASTNREDPRSNITSCTWRKAVSSWCTYNNTFLKCMKCSNRNRFLKVNRLGWTWAKR